MGPALQLLPCTLLAEECCQRLQLQMADDQMEIRTPLPNGSFGERSRDRGVEGTQLGERRVGLRTLHVVRQKPMELLVHERRQLGGVIVDVARIEGEHRMAVRDHARLDQDVVCKEPLVQVIRVQQAAQLVAPALLERGPTLQPNVDGFGTPRLPHGDHRQENNAREQTSLCGN
jgi:hypothetical protein